MASCISNAGNSQDRNKNTLGPIPALGYQTTGLLTKSDLTVLKSYLEQEYNARRNHPKIALSSTTYEYVDEIVLLTGSYDKIQSQLNKMVVTEANGKHYLDGSLTNYWVKADGVTVQVDEDFVGTVLTEQIDALVLKLNELRADCLCHGNCGSDTWCSCHAYVPPCSNCGPY